ncbi:hypothetical protein [Streptomyces yunnanensis]|uniref:Uncharacterized protein n=1 Tax=Streptomyces yunnanensis TaxID=156453 RepID=A0A9X8MT96_9ACTN|nr:hypothetical protein [Streptomyces yunnanensis]SHL74795.1 hypothetical protein SAMN05216268_10662 [Streptomyces yunnanensis]
MAAVTVGTGIRPESTTCCGRQLAPYDRFGKLVYFSKLRTDRWLCQFCHCFLRVAMSGFAPRGLLLVTEANTDACRRGHRAPAVPDFFVDPEANPA